jgi:hypothetical protein
MLPPNILPVIGGTADPNVATTAPQVPKPQGPRPLPDDPGMYDWHWFQRNNNFAVTFLDNNLVRRVEQRLMRILDSTDIEHTELASDGKLRVPGLLARDYDNLFTRTCVASSGMKNLVLIVDMSGSMENYWLHEGGKEFVWAWMQMAKKRLVNLRVFLTGHHSKNHADRSPALRSELPIDTSLADFCKLLPWNGDGMRNTLLTAKIARAITSAHAVVVWTDGDLNDPDVGGRQWTSHGIPLIGCSLSVDKHQILQKHFHVAYTGPELVGLAGRVADAVVQHSRKDGAA